MRAWQQRRWQAAMEENRSFFLGPRRYAPVAVLPTSGGGMGDHLRSSRTAPIAGPAVSTVPLVPGREQGEQNAPGVEERRLYGAMAWWAWRQRSRLGFVALWRDRSGTSLARARTTSPSHMLVGTTGLAAATKHVLLRSPMMRITLPGPELHSGLASVKPGNPA
jgi:hypothetical protein